MKRHTFFLMISVLVLLLSCASTSPAQGNQGGLAPSLPSASAASYYYIAKPGELTMQVNVWGFVQKPGRYEVPTSTDLVQLISFAGGPSDYAKMDEVKITRIARSDSATGKKEIVLDLDNLEKVTDSELVLYPGDTIVIDHTFWLTMRDAFNVIGTAAILTTAIVQVISVSRK